MQEIIVYILVAAAVVALSLKIRKNIKERGSCQGCPNCGNCHSCNRQ
ncbi:MAG: FeoB-associated Cys-rich membrane protein [Bacteroidales bacterium]|nr:FeoB-associated Cys-rich membrane protein [Bacteroidales bacterium]